MMPDSQVTFLLLFLLESICAASVGLSLLQQPVARVRITEVEDYDYEDTTKMTLAPKLPSNTTTRVPQLCDYDPCVAQTSPCIEIATNTGCLCPGLTGPEVRPGAPKLREVKLDHSGEVIVHWCAPLSTVMHYKVTLKGGEGQEWVYGEFLRNGAVPKLKVGEAVCVAAVNQAGVSEEECAPYEPAQPNQATTSAGIIAGCVGILVLVGSLVAVLLWRRRCRKGSMREGEGLGNPSYTNDGAL